VGEIQRKLVRWDERNPISRRFHAKKDKQTIAIWRSDLDEILQVFNTRSAISVKTSVD